jgi:hypothetical protein
MAGAAFIGLAWICGATTVAEIHVLGFTRDNRRVVWREVIHQPATHGSYDEYTLIRVADVRTGKVLHEFRQGAVARRRWDGRPDAAKAEPCPRFQAAKSGRAWHRLAMDLRLRRLRMDAPAVRLQLDPDVRLAHAVARVDEIEVHASPDTSLGYHVAAQLMNGTQVSLARFRGQATAGRVEVFCSADGRAAAVVNHFDAQAELQFAGHLAAPVGIAALPVEPLLGLESYAVASWQRMPRSVFELDTWLTGRW